MIAFGKARDVKKMARSIRTPLIAFLVCHILSACSSPEKADGEELVLKAIEEYRAFRKGELENQSAQLDLSYLEDKFSDIRLCFHHGYGIAGPLSDMMGDRIEFSLNENPYPGSDVKSTIILTKRYSFRYYHYDKWVEKAPSNFERLQKYSPCHRINIQS